MAIQTLMEKRFLDVVEEYREKMREDSVTGTDRDLLIRGVLAVSQTGPGLEVGKESMLRHYIERGLAGVLLVLSLGYAWHGMWSQANYFLFLAAVVDFDDWSMKKK